MRRSLKRVTAVICAVAMVISGMHVATFSSEAADTYTHQFNPTESESGYPKVPVSKLSAVADSWHATDGGNPIGGAFDGNTDTFWHSKWGGEGNTDDNNKVEVTNNVMTDHNTVVVTLEEALPLQGITYLPKQVAPSSDSDGSTNGIVTKLKVEVQADGSQEWTDATGEVSMSYENTTANWNNVKGEREILFHQIYRNTKKVRITFYNSLGNPANTYIAASEMSILMPKDEIIMDRLALSLEVKYPVPAFGYTESSYEAYKGKVSAGREALLNPDATEGELAEALAAIRTAKESLEKKRVWLFDTELADLNHAGLGNGPLEDMLDGNQNTYTWIQNGNRGGFIIAFPTLVNLSGITITPFANQETDYMRHGDIDVSRDGITWNRAGAAEGNSAGFSCSFANRCENVAFIRVSVNGNGPGITYWYKIAEVSFASLEETPVSKIALQTKIDELTALDLVNRYTEDSVQALLPKLEDAMATLNSYATQEEVDNALAALTAAGNALVCKFASVQVAAGEGGTAAVTGVAESGEVLKGTNVTFTATANPGYAFVNWTLTNAEGTEVSTDAVYTKAITEDTVLYANFVRTVDKAALTALIADAKAITDVNYTVSSYAALQTAIAAAEAVANDEEALQDAVDAQVTALQAAIDALASKANFGGLTEAIERAEAWLEDHEEAHYNGVAEVKEKLAAAQALAAQDLSDDDQVEIDAAAQALLTALQNLTLKAADYSELEAVLEQAANLTEADYTAGSWAALIAAVAEAEDVADNLTILDQAQVDAAKDAVAAAIEALVELADYTELNQVIAQTETLVKGQYTEESWEALSEALAAVKPGSGSQEEVDGWKTAIEKAIENLKQKPMKTGYKVIVNDKVLYEDCAYDTMVTLKAEEPEDGKVFAGWTINGVPVSLEPTYRFAVTGDVVCKSVYKDSVKPLKEKAEMANVIATKNALGKTDIQFVGRLVVPEGYILAETGLLYAVKETPAELTYGATGVYKTIAPKVSNSYQFSVTIKNTPADRFVRGVIFAKLVNENDTSDVKYVYSAEQKAYAYK